MRHSLFPVFVVQPDRPACRSLPLTPLPYDINGFADPNASELTGPDPTGAGTAVLLISCWQGQVRKAA